MNLTDSQIERYSRHIILKEIGGEGQKKILNTKVVIIGAGGLGSPAAYYLAAAGVGKIGIVDSDRADLSNLQRQILHFTKDVGRLKTESAQEKLTAINPDCEVVPHTTRLNAKNVLDIIGEYDAVINGSDNFPTRYLINDACIISKTLLFEGAVIGFSGQAITIKPHESACYRCLYEEPPPPGLIPSCQEAGVMGAIPGVIGIIQATEVIKWILGKGSLLTDRLLIYNGLEMEFNELEISRNPQCPVCGDNPSIKGLREDNYQVDQVCERR
ncbi:MAG: molybdopterin-synthase adenylyltransferase MoeB [Deltaproteobacteria bacterium]|nr:molybdopterin-synthase adenylyltransferase MoeB [Deltaproteobacteria bacterium]